MKRLLSSIISLALGLAPFPVQAQVALGRASLQTGAAAPTPVPSGLVPVAGGFVPSLTAPALSVSLAPAAAVSPAIAAPIALLPVSAVPVRIEAKAPLAVLRAVAAPESAPFSGAAFDGSRSAASVAEPEAVVDSPKANHKPRRSLLQRYKDKRNKTPLQNAFGRAMFATALSAAAVPVLWGAAPAMKYLYAMTAADALMFALILPLSVGIAIWKKLRRAPQTASTPPPSRRAKLAAIAAGVLLGLGAAVAPYQAVGPVNEIVHSITDRNKTVEQQDRVRWISGGAVEDETVKALSLNPVGRELLDQLRDRGGVLRLPSFYLSRQDDSYAQHENFYGGVYLNEGEVTGRGWTVSQFLKDPALQRQLIREMNSTVFHELVHEVQGRRAAWNPAQFANATETEQEAFLRQTLFLIAELEADPAKRNNGHDQWQIIDAAADLDGFLKSVAAMYENNVVVGEPYFNAFLAEQRARWPAFRVHIYQVLAARAHSPVMAKMYMDKAKAAAKEAGLPEPAELVASR